MTLEQGCPASGVFMKDNDVFQSCYNGVKLKAGGGYAQKVS